MSYATVDQLNAALTAANISPAPAPTELMIDAALHNADSRVNMSITAGKYPLPSAPYSTSLVNAATAIALYNLLLDLRRSPRTITSVNTGYQAALEYLNQIAQKKIAPTA